MTATVTSASNSKRWRLENPEKVKEQARRYREANREKIRSKVKRDPVKAAERRKRWYAANREKAKEHSRLWWEKNGERVRAANRAKTAAGLNKGKYSKWRRDNLLKQYGIRPHEYDELLAAQNGVCKLCGGINENERLLHVDHCHDTGVIRGLLCIHCNMGIGQFRDKPELMRKAAAYVESFANQQEPLLKAA